MSTKSIKRNQNKKLIETLNLNFKYFKIYVQCPYCGDLLKVNPERNYPCKECNHTFSEKEIREKSTW